MPPRWIRVKRAPTYRDWFCINIGIIYTNRLPYTRDIENALNCLAVQETLISTGPTTLGRLSEMPEKQKPITRFPTKKIIQKTFQH